MAKRRKAIRAGRLVKVSLYSCPFPSDGDAARAAKSKCSSRAQQEMNLRHAWQKLEMQLAANFSFGDLHVTLTYDDDHLPDCRDDAIARIKKFVIQLRKARRRKGDELLYVYVTEGQHGDKRLHHHIVINATSDDLAMVKAWWPYGDVQIEYINDRGYEGLAKYLTKEPREHGGTGGLRSWTPSRGLKKPEVKSGWVPDDVTVSAPPGAIILEAEPPYRNEYGEFSCIKYLLPESSVRKRKGRPSRRKRRKN